MNTLRLRKKLPRVVVNVVVVAAIVIWFLPTLGLLVTSLRPREIFAYSVVDGAVESVEVHPVYCENYRMSSPLEDAQHFAIALSSLSVGQLSLCS